MTPSSSIDTKQATSQLQARRKVVLSRIQDHLHSSDEPNKLVLLNHLEEVQDWSETDVLNDTDIAILDNELAELRAIDAALSRIKTSAYGMCIDCGIPIPANRLQAQITALRCIGCQTNADKRHGLEHGTSI
jgi:DnaK suppressor protein